MTTQRNNRRGEPSGKIPDRGWAALISDLAGTDGDIAKLVGTYSTKLGCSREKACAALVKKLSGVGSGGIVRQLEEVC